MLYLCRKARILRDMIQELVEFCDASFAPNTKGFPCNNEPFTSCIDCLKEIHFNKTSERKYDCVNMCHWYVCQDIYRYASEMAWLLHDKDLGLRTRTSPLNICSIGCGPCSELIAIEEYRKKYGLTFEYTYTGFDLNNVWNPIQNKVASLSASPDVIRFVHGDVFEYYSRSDERPNMIILNYMLSDMLKYGQDAFSTFIENLCNFVAELPSCAVLINDINRGVDKTDPRGYYSTIHGGIAKGCGWKNIEAKRYHFADSMKNYYTYGVQRPKSAILFDAPEAIVSKYATNTECHSAQMTIIKKKESTK